MDFDYVLSEVSTFIFNNTLCCFDILSFCLTSKNNTLLFNNKHLDLLYLFKYNKWMNHVVYSTINCEHLIFINRLSVNFTQISEKFNYGNVHIKTLKNIRRFVDLNEIPICEHCKINHVSGVIRFLHGYKMVNSRPCLNFGCKSCLKNCIMSCMRCEDKNSKEATITHMDINNLCDFSWQNTREYLLCDNVV